MMGRQPNKEPLFYYFCWQDQIPEGHLLRLIDRHVEFHFVRERLRGSISTGVNLYLRQGGRGRGIK
jgi:transposase